MPATSEHRGGPANVLAWALFALVPALFATFPWFDRLARDAGRPDLALLAPFVIAPSVAALTASVVGVVLASRRPRHPVGWLLLALGLCMAFGGVIAGYLPYTVVARPGSLPAAGLVARVYTPLTDAALAAIGFVLLLIPTGSPPSPGWRRWAWGSGVALAVLLVAATGVLVALGDVGPAGWTSVIGTVFLPLAAGAAISRYRLFDLDQIISRTVAWTVLIVLLGLGYAGVVLGLGRLLPDSSSLAVAAATLAVAAVFQPARLRDQVDLDTLTAEVLAVVDQTMQPTRAWLWQRPPPAAGR